MNPEQLCYKHINATKIIDETLNITDPNDDSLCWAKVEIMNEIDLGMHHLSFENQNNITSEYTNGQLFLSSDDSTVTDFEDILRSIVYEYYGDNFPRRPVTISFEVSDGYYNSNIATREIYFDDVCEDHAEFPPWAWEFPPWAWGLVSAAGATVVAITATVLSVGAIWIARKYGLCRSRGKVQDVEFAKPEIEMQDNTQMEQVLKDFIGIKPYSPIPSTPPPLEVFGKGDIPDFVPPDFESHRKDYVY